MGVEKITAYDITHAISLNDVDEAAAYLKKIASIDGSEDVAQFLEPDKWSDMSEDDRGDAIAEWLYAEKQNRRFNRFQRHVADTYANGEYAHINRVGDAEEVDDTLFVFLIRELDDCEEWEDWDMAASRLRTAIRDIEHVLNKMEGAE